MKPKQLRIIKCPTCGYEYLPAEIYLPNEFLGKPKTIMKDISGKIIGFDGIKMNDTETYKCDNCDTMFEVVSTTYFNSKPIGNSSEEYVTKLSTDKFILQEL
jgi:DNA-directed RNA polymerase subunit RPC12/RpoP